MHSAIFKDILTKINEKIKEESSFIKFSNEEYTPISISKDNFYAIDNLKTSKKIAFIDGGGQEIVRAPNFSVNFFRVFYTIYKNNHRTNAEKKEFYTLTYTYDKNNEIFYKVDIYPLNFKIDSFEISSLDKNLKKGDHRITISDLNAMILRFAELEGVSFIAQNKLADIILMDGTLEPTYTNEELYLNKIFSEIEKKKIIFTALSKSSTWFTDSGNSVIGAFKGISSLPEWYYYPIVDNKSETHRAEIYLTKLNKFSDFIFRFEIFNEQNKDAKEVLSLLKDNANDIIIPGYPYGLIEADKFARISNRERDYLKTIFNVNSNHSLKPYTLDLHDRLDKISFWLQSSHKSLNKIIVKVLFYYKRRCFNG